MVDQVHAGDEPEEIGAVQHDGDVALGEDRLQVGQRLGGVVDVALQVNQARALLQDALPEAVVQRLADFPPISITLPKVGIVSDVRQEFDKLHSAIK